MKATSLVPLLAAAALAGCAATTGHRDAAGNPILERLSVQELAQLSPPRPLRMTENDLVQLSREGVPPDRIIDLYYESGTRMKLTAAQMAQLRAAGVDQSVIDYVVTAELAAENTDRLTSQADQAAAARLAFKRAYNYAYAGQPYYGIGILPYAGYGWSRYGSGWYGGVGVGF